MNYTDFDLRISPAEDGYYRINVVQSKAGTAEVLAAFPFDQQELRVQLLTLQNALLKSTGQFRTINLPEEKAVVQFGQTLFNAVFCQEVRSLYDASRADARRRGKGLRIRVHCAVPELVSLPWEFLYDPTQNDFLALADSTPVIRNLDAPHEKRPLRVSTLPLRILGMIASPIGLSPINVSAEMQRVEQALDRPVKEGLIELAWVKEPTAHELLSAMRSGPWHIFHFVGHGQFSAASEEGWIVLCDEDGQPKPLLASQLARALVHHKDLRLVVLNSCHTAQSGPLNVFSSTASVLVHQGIPAVIAMQHAITEAAALEFSRTFYETLANGEAVDSAVTEARKSISFAFTHTLEWGTPVIYTYASNLRMLPEHLKQKVQTEPSLPLIASAITTDEIHKREGQTGNPEQVEDVAPPPIEDRLVSESADEATSLLQPVSNNPGNKPSEDQAPALSKVGKALLFGLVSVAMIGGLIFGVQQFYSRGGLSQTSAAPPTSKILIVSSSTPKPTSLAVDAVDIATPMPTKIQASTTDTVVTAISTVSLLDSLFAKLTPTRTLAPTSTSPPSPTSTSTAVPANTPTLIPTAAPSLAVDTAGGSGTPQEDTNAPFAADDVRLNFPFTDAIFDYPNSPLFLWSSTQPLAASQHYLLKILHGKGTDF